MAFDLETMDQQETATIQILHPVTGEELGASVTVYGSDSEIFRAESMKIENRFFDFAARNRGKRVPIEIREEMEMDRIAACVKSIDGLQYKGEDITDARQVFKTFPWIYEQVSAGVFERANFIKGSLAK